MLIITNDELMHDYFDERLSDKVVGTTEREHNIKIAQIKRKGL